VPFLSWAGLSEVTDACSTAGTRAIAVGGRSARRVGGQGAHAERFPRRHTARHWEIIWRLIPNHVCRRRGTARFFSPGIGVLSIFSKRTSAGLAWRIHVVLAKAGFAAAGHARRGREALTLMRAPSPFGFEAALTRPPARGSEGDSRSTHPAKIEMG